jgi:hypothetical protein
LRLAHRRRLMKNDAEEWHSWFMHRDPPLPIWGLTG